MQPRATQMQGQGSNPTKSRTQHYRLPNECKLWASIPQTMLHSVYMSAPPPPTCITAAAGCGLCCSGRPQVQKHPRAPGVAGDGVQPIVRGLEPLDALQPCGLAEPALQVCAQDSRGGRGEEATIGNRYNSWAVLLILHEPSLREGGLLTVRPSIDHLHATVGTKMKRKQWEKTPMHACWCIPQQCIPHPTSLTICPCMIGTNKLALVAAVCRHSSCVVSAHLHTANSSQCAGRSWHAA